MDTSHQPTDRVTAGFRMLDVRQSIAQAGGGLASVEKIEAGHYTVRTLDGRTWDLALRLPARLWYGVVVAAPVKTVRVEGMGGGCTAQVMAGPKLASGAFWGWEA
jgi:hypothetical protein